MTLDILSPRVAEILTSRTAERIAPGELDEDMLSKKRWALTAGFCGNAKILGRYADGATQHGSGMRRRAHQRGSRA